MRRIVAAEYLSLDGVTEDPGPAGEYEHLGWTVPYWNDDIDKWQTDQLSRSDALLLDRVTYEEFVASWPSRSGDPFSDRMNSLTKFVASTTLREPLEWNSTLLEGDVVDAVADPFDDAGRLMAEQHGHGPHAVAVDDAEVGVADSRRFDAHEQLARPGGIEFELTDGERVRLRERRLRARDLEHCSGDLHPTSSS